MLSSGCNANVSKGNVEVYTALDVEGRRLSVLGFSALSMSTGLKAGCKYATRICSNKSSLKPFRASA